MFLKDILSLFGRWKKERGVEMGPRQRALHLYCKYFNIDQNIKEDNFATDLDYILKEMDISLYSADMEEIFPNTPNPNYDVSACIRKENGKYTIYVNKYEPLVRQRFSIAHEIAHFYLEHLDDKKPMDICFRDDSSSKGKDRREIEANAFASTLLMPKKMVLVLYNAGFDVRTMADLFCVSQIAVEYRLKNLRLM